MERLEQAPKRSTLWPAYAVAAYWAINLALFLAELRWHILSRLTAFDISLVRVLIERLLHTS
jgi:hypothetical protein